MKKILALVACLSLVASLAIGGSIAYLTASDSVENTFTIGNVSIDINENGFQKGEELKPGYPTTKTVTIKNTGDNDAYVWATIVVEPEVARTNNIIELNYKNSTANDWIEKGNNTFLYRTKLNGADSDAVSPVYETSELLESVTLNKFVDVINGKLVKVENGVQTEICSIDDIKVVVNAYAIQSEGIDSVEQAYDLYKDQWGTNDNATPSGGVSSLSEMSGALSKPNSTVSLGADLALSTTENIMMKNGGTIYGNNTTITKTEYTGGDKGFNAGIETAGGTIDGLNVVDAIENSEKGLRAVYMTSGMKEDLIINNCDLAGTYAINVNGSKPADGTTYKLIVTDSQLRGWVSYGTIIGKAEFTDVGFHGGTGGYKNLRPYADTTITDCDFDESYTLDVGAEGITIAIVNSRYNNQPLTAENFKQLVEADDIASFANVIVTVDGTEVTDFGA